MIKLNTKIEKEKFFVYESEYVWISISIHMR